MSHRLEIAFATCTPTLGALERVAERFATIAAVRQVAAVVDGGNVDEVRPAVLDGAPDAVVAFPKPAAGLIRADVRVPVLTVEYPADVLLTRVESALEGADSVAVLPPAGSVSAATARLVRRLGGSVHILPYENHGHLKDLVVRCQRMGVQALVGGESLLPYAEDEGLRGFSMADGPDEAAGVMGQAVLKAAMQAAPRHSCRADELARLGLILEKIAQGAIGPRDSALCVDRRGRVVAAFTPPAAGRAGHGASLAIPAGVSVLEAVAASTAHAANGEEEGPLALDLFPLTNGAGDGYLVVLRSTPRALATLPGDSAGLDATDARVGRLLERVDALLERTDGLTRSRRARRAPRRFLASLRRRTFLLDWSQVRYFELRSGLVYAALATGETYATNYTLADVAARVDPRDFFRIHRNVIVNLNYVTELERYGVSQFRVAIEGPDAPSFVVSRPASAALRKLLKY